VFTRSLSQTEIQSLPKQLTGSENGLLAGYTFNQGSLPAKLARPVTLSGAAQQVAVSANRASATDAARLPLPTQHVEARLPFPPGEEWLVIQGYADPNGSHHGYAAFSWDFGLANKPCSSQYPYGSSGAPLYASAPGKVVTAHESEPAGTATSNLLELELAPNEIHGYLHIRQNGALVNLGNTVSRGQQVALTGSTGASCDHLHFATTDIPDAGLGLLTFPIAFSNYEVRGVDGAWRPVSRGIPKVGEVVRNRPSSMTNSGGPVGAASQLRQIRYLPRASG
jgi:hypothetical protein